LDGYADKMSDALFIALTERKLHTPDIGVIFKNYNLRLCVSFLGYLSQFRYS